MIKLNVINRDHVGVGFVVAEVGIETTMGPITRMTDRTVWTRGQDGIERQHRVYDGRVPSVYRSKVAASKIIPKG